MFLIEKLSLQIEKAEAADTWVGPDLPRFVALRGSLACRFEIRHRRVSHNLVHVVFDLSSGNLAIVL
jgi:hypothetical protein